MLSKILFNRIFYIALAMLIQLGWISLMVWRLNNYSKYVSVGISILSFLMVLWIVNNKINPSYKLAWTIVILEIPIFGLLFYILFGKSRVAKTMQSHFDAVLDKSRTYLKEDETACLKIRLMDPSVSCESSYITNFSRYPLHEHTIADYYSVGNISSPTL